MENFARKISKKQDFELIVDMCPNKYLICENEQEKLLLKIRNDFQRKLLISKDNIGFICGRLNISGTIFKWTAQKIIPDKSNSNRYLLKVS